MSRKTRNTIKRKSHRIRGGKEVRFDRSDTHRIQSLKSSINTSYEPKQYSDKNPISSMYSAKIASEALLKIPTTKYTTESYYNETHPETNVIKKDLGIYYGRNNADGIPYYMLYKMDQKPCLGSGRIFNYKEYCKYIGVLKLIASNVGEGDSRKAGRNSVIHNKELQRICDKHDNSSHYSDEQTYNAGHDYYTSDVKGENEDGIPRMYYLYRKNRKGKNGIFTRKYTFAEYNQQLPVLKYIISHWDTPHKTNSTKKTDRSTIKSARSTTKSNRSIKKRTKKYYKSI